MLKIYRNEDNKVVLQMKDKGESSIVIEVMDEYCILHSDGKKQQTYFNEGVLEVSTSDQESSIYLRKEAKQLHVYNDQQIDVYIR